MISKKIILSVATIAIIYSGCQDKEVVSTEEPVEVKKVETTVDKVVNNQINNVEPTVEKVKEVTEEVIKAVATPDAKVLYVKCAGCHGANGEKVALGKSKIIKGWDSLKITNAINGYKDGTYGGTMKGLMKSQVISLNDKEIELLSKYISAF
ncbi:MAG: hypothetical protein U9R39_11060 [Campylobacterota bacterium]|nr:hypothetical protein [Campylobacterota bacterium]